MFSIGAGLRYVGLGVSYTLTGCRHFFRKMLQNPLCVLYCFFLYVGGRVYFALHTLMMTFLHVLYNISLRRGVQPIVIFL